MCCDTVKVLNHKGREAQGCVRRWQAHKTMLLLLSKVRVHAAMSVWCVCVTLEQLCLCGDVLRYRKGTEPQGQRGTRMCEKVAGTQNHAAASEQSQSACCHECVWKLLCNFLLLDAYLASCNTAFPTDAKHKSCSNPQPAMCRCVAVFAVGFYE